MKFDVIYNEDCLDGLKRLPSKSVDLILTDPPYNIAKAEWDKIPDYINWCGKWIKESERILKDNGTFYFWHNDMIQIAQLMEWIRQNTKFVYNSFCIWDKGDFRALAWKQPTVDNKLRSWFNICEFCLVYTFQDDTGLSNVMLDVNNFPTMRGYFRDLQQWIGRNKKQIIDVIGQNADHCFRWESSQWDLPTPETYSQIIDKFNIRNWEGFQEYEALRQEYEALRQEYEALRFTHKLDKNHNNVWKSEIYNDGKDHPTQKPIDILARIINTSSNIGDTVLDPFMGSGSTAVAALNTGRHYIGFETDKTFFDIAQKRCKDYEQQPNLFTHQELYIPPVQGELL